MSSTWRCLHSPGKLTSWLVTVKFKYVIHLSLPGYMVTESCGEKVSVSWSSSFTEFPFAWTMSYRELTSNFLEQSTQQLSKHVSLLSMLTSKTRETGCGCRRAKETCQGRDLIGLGSSIQVSRFQSMEGMNHFLKERRFKCIETWTRMPAPPLAAL